MSEENTAETTDGGAASARIRQLVTRVKELEARVVELEPLAASADKWRGQVEELKGATTAEREALRVEREIMAAGILDAEGLDYVQHAYQRLPAENRPALSEWLSNRDGLPKAVRAYLPELPTAPASTAPAPVSPPPAVAPKTSVGTVPPPASEPQAWTTEAISRLSPAEFAQHRAAIFASLRAG
jgi:hypothetical protein